MKRILIVSHNLEIGGVERSLIGLLYALGNYNIIVDLFLFKHSGELLKYIPSNINLLPEIKQYTVLGRPMIDTLKEGHLLLTGARLFGKLRAAEYNKRNKLVHSDVAVEYSHKYTRWFMPEIASGQNYDLAVSFLTPHYFTAEKVRAKKKVAWIHTDYSMIRIDVDSELKMWSEYDIIIAITDSVKNSFLKVFPSLEERIEIIQNILPKKIIEQEVTINTTVELPDRGIKLLSIGRFCYAKNFDSVPDICRIIADSGLDVYWFLIGYGPDEQLIKKRIKEKHMEDRVIILGKKDNPYPYIQKCDLYVQPSRYEGNSVSVREAQLLNKPVVVADYPTAHSQLIDGVDGIIASNKNYQFAKTLVDLLTNKDKVQKLVDECRRRDYSCLSESKKLIDLIP